MICALHVARRGYRRCVHRALVGEPEGKRPLGRPRRRWEDNIKMIFKKWDREAWTRLIWLGTGTRGRELENEVMKLRVP